MMHYAWLMARIFITLGAINGFLAVALGAFAAHGLKQRIDPDMLAVFETGARYHSIHSVALVAVGLLALHHASGSLSAAGISLLVGMLLFSGSLYVMAVTGIRGLGAITPFGGLALLAGWALMAYSAWRDLA